MLMVCSGPVPVPLPPTLCAQKKLSQFPQSHNKAVFGLLYCSKNDEVKNKRLFLTVISLKLREVHRHT